MTAVVRLVLALYAACLVACLQTAQAQAITNVASASWREHGLTRSVRSNTLITQVPALQSQLAVLPVTVGAANLMTLDGGVCGTKVLEQVSVDETIAHAATPLTIRQLTLGQPIVFRLQLSSALLQAGRIDQLQVTLASASGDAETITVTETAPDSATFFGALPTSAIPPQPVLGDCRLSLADGDRITVTYRDRVVSSLIAQAEVEVLSDPYGLLFDSEDGTPITGAKVTLVDAATGQPALVRADDGRTSWPSTVTTGHDVTDGAGNVWPMPPGEYRFPLVPLGRYRLVVSPPGDYTAPSGATRQGMAGLRRPDGAPMVIVPASFGEELALSSLAPVRVDIPLDRPARAASVTKSASRDVAEPGDTVFYKVNVRNTDQIRGKTGLRLEDHSADTLRLRPDSIRVAGAAVASGSLALAQDGRGFVLDLGNLGPGEERLVTYAMAVRQDAAGGFADNRVRITDSRGLTGLAAAQVRIERDSLVSTMTLVGRVTIGDCTVRKNRPGLSRVRIAMEDGSFAVTDAEGRYHFEGLVPGTHVIELQSETLPQGARLVDCARSTRSAGSTVSRLITGQGGSLASADFAVVLPEEGPQDIPSGEAVTRPIAGEGHAVSVQDEGQAASGGGIDWLALGDGPTDFLFPAPDHNPRAPAIRVVIRHRAGEKVALRVDGKSVDTLAFDGVRTSSEGYAVSIWTGIPLNGEETLIEADVRGANSAISASLSRTVRFSATPARVELVPELSRLVADGRTRAVLAIRVLDRKGRPVHAGLGGILAISAPYESAAALDAIQGRLPGSFEQQAPVWTVKGDDGIAYVELAPTMVSGRVELAFEFVDREVKRRQLVETWLVPGAQKWTLVGIAEAAVGARSIAQNMQRAARFDSDLGQNARLALYAKGRIKGKYLLTLAYDSAKQRAEQRLLGGLDPKAYYTVFGDGSDRRYDAASTGKLYIRVESDRLRALFGDIVTGFDHTVLSRYQRTMTGTLIDASAGNARIGAFAAQTANAHRRDEIPGSGLSGPYRLSSRRLVPNSESVTLEVRDRFRSELVLSSRKLVRFVDYEVDIISGTVLFKEPVLSRDDNLNPRTIVVEYDVDTTAPGAWNAGVRGELAVQGTKLRLGATAITEAGQDTDAGQSGRTNLVGLDARLRLGDALEVRGETALTKTQGSQAQVGYLLEVERHDARSDVLAYVRSIDARFGLGQASTPELGRRKLGLDARYALSSALSVTASAARDEALGDGAHRDMVQVRTTWQTPGFEARLGLAHYAETKPGGGTANASLVEAGATRRLLDNRLELSASGSFVLGQSDSSSWQPPRYRLGGRFAITPSVRIVSDYEMAQSDKSDTRIMRAGFEVAPWTGARMTSVLGRQDIAEQGRRVFAAYGLAQSLPVGTRLILDASIDGNARVGGRSFTASSGTAIAGSTVRVDLTEDFTAYTLGANWRAGRWALSGRAELRDGSLVRRQGLTFGAVRQLGEGSIVGLNFTSAVAQAESGERSRSVNAAVSLAHRPGTSRLAILAKAEVRSDLVESADSGADGLATRFAAGPFTVTSDDARSTRIIASMSANLAPFGQEDGAMVQRQEFAVFVAARHNLDRYDDYDLKGTTVLAGADLRQGIGERVEFGVSATVRKGIGDGTMAFAAGPQLGVVAARNTMVVIGYNLAGFRDRDFADVRGTRRGLFATVRMKLDSAMLASLGVGR